MAAAGGFSRRVRERSAKLAFSFVDLTDTAAFEAAIRPETRMLWVETPTNPLLKLVDLSALAALGAQARHHHRLRQHLRQPLGAAAASSMASTSSCIRRPNI